MEISEVYKKYIVVFVDLLGFKEAVESNEKKEIILELLEQMKFFNNEQEQVNTWQDGGTHCTTVHPKAITFSDCIVISITNERCSWLQAIIQIKHHLIQLARIAHYRGFLIRGGIIMGDLYHKDNIIF